MAYLTRARERPPSPPYRGHSHGERPLKGSSFHTRRQGSLSAEGEDGIAGGRLIGVGGHHVVVGRTGANVGFGVIILVPSPLRLLQPR